MDRNRTFIYKIYRKVVSLVAKGAEIRNVIIKFPKDVKIEEIERRACQAYARILCEMYPSEVIEKNYRKIRKYIIQIKQIQK